MLIARCFPYESTATFVWNGLNIPAISTNKANSENFTESSLIRFQIKCYIFLSRKDQQRFKVDTSKILDDIASNCNAF